MAFTGKSIDELTADLLGYEQTEYAAATPPRTLLVSRGSDAWMRARALAYMLAGLEAMAAQNARDILPDQASDEAVARFGNVYGVPRRPGVAAQLSVDVTGTPSATVAIPFGSALAWTDGTLYACTSPSVTLDGSGDGTVTVEATTVGATTTRDDGDVLTWQSAPAGLDPTGTVAGSPITTGADVESFGDWAQRIIGRLRDRPASGNRADWKAWCEAFAGLDIRKVWVYPLLQPPASYPGAGTQNVLGCVTVVCAGPAQGDSATNSRVLGGSSGAALGTVKAYIEGLVDASGLVVTDGEQLRPVTMAAADYGVETITERTPTNVQATLVTNAANRFSFSAFSMPVVGGGTSTSTSLVVTGDFTSGSTDVTGLAALVNVGTSNYRGGYYRVVLPAGTYDGGSGRTTFNLAATPLPAAPESGSRVYGCPGCWGALRLAVFDFFDALGPGDTTPAGRFPTEDSGDLSTLYPDALRGLMAGVPGVVSANVTLPAAAVTPDPKQVVTLGTFLVIGS